MKTETKVKIAAVGVRFFGALAIGYLVLSSADVVGELMRGAQELAATHG